MVARKPSSGGCCRKGDANQPPWCITFPGASKDVPIIIRSKAPTRMHEPELEGAEGVREVIDEFVAQLSIHTAPDFGRAWREGVVNAKTWRRQRNNEADLENRHDYIFVVSRICKVRYH